MAGKGKGTAETLSDQITLIKYLLAFSNALILVSIKLNYDILKSLQFIDFIFIPSRNF